MKDHLEDIEAQGTDLIVLPAKEDLPAYFLGQGGDSEDQGIAELVARIEAPLKNVTHDVTTAKGRKEARSVASKVSKSKTVLESVRKDITQDWRDKTAKVNAAGKIATERLDALRDRIKAPADEFEAKQAEKLRLILLRMDAFKTDVLSAHDSSAELLAKIDEIEALEVDASFEDQEGEARILKAAALDKYRSDLGIAVAREKADAELEELRAEKATREAEEAKRLAKEEEDRAAAEREKQERLQAEQSEKEQLEAAERAKEEAEELAKRQAREAEERHQRELQEAKEREERAAQAERDRIAQEQADKTAAAAKRAADAEHRAKIRGQIVQSFVDLGPDGWEAAVDAMIDGKIPHITVQL